MRENTPKRQLYAGKAAFGVMCTFSSPVFSDVALLWYMWQVSGRSWARAASFTITSR